jgi:NAD(P)-dependent dehydrogenase (short-subunit alcohol dehydrogenase family)
MSDVALVTGAGSGIGRAAAIALLRKGWRVTLAGRRPEPLEETAALAGAGSDQALAAPTDVRDPASVRALFDACQARFNRLDLLFNNAGLALPPTPLDAVDWEDWRRVIETNVDGAFLCIQNAFRLMKAQDPQGGRILNNGSISAHVPRMNSAAYTASKHAMTGLTRAASLEGRAFNIACGQIDIGNTRTAITQPFTAGTVQASGEVSAEPTFDVQHVADAVVYIAGLPLEANVQFMTLMASKMPYIGRG